MDLSLSTCSWCGLAVLLLAITFGPHCGYWLLMLFTFLAGLLLMLYIYGQQRTSSWIQHSRNEQWNPSKIGLNLLVDDVMKGRPKLKMDKRMTGSTVIDDVLQELLGYTYRDYIHMWYHKISDEDQFQYDIRQALQRVVIAFSERAKEVDLVPYLTRRLVDDFASHIRLYRRALTKVVDNNKDNLKPPIELESMFFDLETEMERNMSRDHISQYETSERQYLQEVSEVLMFLLLPPADFHNKLFRYIVREVLVNGILLPMVNMVSDPDFINQTISWLCKESMFHSDSFLTILKTSDSIDEMQAVREKVDLDIARQRSKDSGGDNDILIKQQLSSLLFVKSVCETRIQQLRDGVEDTELILPGGLDVNQLLYSGQKLYPLSFDVVLNNAVALSFFIEFMTSIDAQTYLFFYLTVEGYRVSAEQQLSAALLSSNTIDKSDIDAMREAALCICNQYLSEKASPRLHLDEQSVRSVLSKIDKGDDLDSVFDEIQGRVCDMLQEEPRFFAAFKKSPLYVKLLMELDLLQDTPTVSKAEDALSLDEDTHSVASQPGSIRDDSPDDCDSVSSNECALPYPPNTFTLSASISNTGTCREHGKEYAVYLISCLKKLPDGSETSWDVCRRYSDFHDFQMAIQNKFEALSSLPLPKKKAFDNMNKEFLERRKVGLNMYLQAVLNPSVLHGHRGLIDDVYRFLEHMHWERDKRTELERKMDTFVNPFRSSVRNVGNLVRSMPDNFVDGVARVSGNFRSIPNNMLDGVGKLLHVRAATGMAPAIKVALKTEGDESGKVSESLNPESDDDSIPLHIMLLLMDEVFDLKSRNQWLRRRIVAILQQIAKHMFGESINRRIVEHVAYLTAPEQIAEYMRQFRESFWPNGCLAGPRQPRDYNTKMRTRVVCKAKLFGSLSEELQHLIGAETTRQGVLLVFNMFQHQRLNRRLAYVVFEGLLETIFPDNKFDETFRKIHSTSLRVKKQT